jgi:hypothetical protein
LLPTVIEQKLLSTFTEQKHLTTFTEQELLPNFTEQKLSPTVIEQKLIARLRATPPRLYTIPHHTLYTSIPTLGYIADTMGQVTFAEDTKLPQDTQTEEEQTSVFNYQDGPEHKNESWAGALPIKQGLYDPANEKDACGVGFAAHIKGKASHKIVSDGKNSRERKSGWGKLANLVQHAHFCAT